MKLKKIIFVNFLSFCLVFTFIITPIFSHIQLGDTTLPIDEDGFIEYDFEDEFAPSSLEVKVKFSKKYIERLILNEVDKWVKDCDGMTRELKIVTRKDTGNIRYATVVYRDKE